MNEKLNNLYVSISLMLLKLSAKGTIEAKDSKVGGVMDALYEIDSGVYIEDISGVINE